MRLFRFARILTALAAPALLAPSPAHANIEYPWCAVYGGMSGGGTNCGFSTIEQCRLTVSGIGGFCEPNQFYNSRAQAEPKHKRKPKH